MKENMNQSMNQDMNQNMNGALNMNPNMNMGQPPYQAPVFNETVTLSNWMITMLLMCIPIVNIVMLFVWGFGESTAPSKKNWARAALIWMVIGIVAAIVLGAVFGAALMGSMYY